VPRWTSYIKDAGLSYKGRGTVASDTVGWDEYELGGSSNGTTARDGDLLLDTQPASIGTGMDFEPRT
jgi:hypothetical protein